MAYRALERQNALLERQNELLEGLARAGVALPGEPPSISFQEAPGDTKEREASRPWIPLKTPQRGAYGCPGGNGFGHVKPERGRLRKRKKS